MLTYDDGHWLDYDAAALAVLLICIGGVMLLVLLKYSTLYTVRAPLPKFGQPAVTLLPIYRSGLPPGRVSNGERTMTSVVLDILLYSCTAVFIVGIVIAAAQFL
jgi:hypothetical protein